MDLVQLMIALCTPIFLSLLFSSFAHAFSPARTIITRSSLFLSSSDLVSVAKKEGSDIVEVAKLVSSIEGTGSAASILERRSSLVGNYRVLTTYNPAKLDVKSNAAGGKWVRPGSVPSKLGFKVDGLYQNIVEEADNIVAINLVLLSFLQFFVVTVVLRGDCDYLSDEEVSFLFSLNIVLHVAESLIRRFAPLLSQREDISTRRNVDTGGLSDLCIRAKFDSPLIRLGFGGWRGPGINFRIGPSSSVILDASYVDNEVRIGKGASGVRFVLERVSVEDAAAERWRKVVDSRLKIGKRELASILAFISGVAVAAGRRWFGAAGLILTVFTTASTGGIIREEAAQAEV